MSLEAFFKSLSITKAVRERQIKGVTEICPANASFQVNFDPDVITPDDMLAELKELEAQVGRRRASNCTTRIIEIPVLLQRSLDARDADARSASATRIRTAPTSNMPPASTATTRSTTSSRRIPARPGSSRWSASSPACRSSIRWSSGEADRGAEISAAAHRHAEADRRPWRLLRRIYSVRGAGGYQMFGITPMPIYDPDQKISLSSRTSWPCSSPGDIVKFKPIDREDYDATSKRSRPARSTCRSATVTFSLDEFQRRSGRLQPASWWRRSMAIEVIKPGLATTVQDLGRPGYYHLGIPLSGALDQFALRAANLLVGNDEGAAVLEAACMGPELVFRAPMRVVAVTGAELTPKVDGEARPRWTSFAVKAGDKLCLRFPESRRARLHRRRRRHRRAGRARQPLDLCARRARRLHRAASSRPATCCRSASRASGARAGRRLARELTPRCPEVAGAARAAGPLLAPHHRRGRPGASSRTPGRSRRRPTASAIASAAAAARFRAERKQPFGAGSDPSNIVDACYPYGSIQVPGGTEPIVLHRDAVSGGGYFMIGTVISADMDLSGSCSRTISPALLWSTWRPRSRRVPSIRRATPGCGRCCPRNCQGAVQVAAAVTDASY